MHLTNGGTLQLSWCPWPLVALLFQRGSWGRHQLPTPPPFSWPDPHSDPVSLTTWPLLSLKNSWISNAQISRLVNFLGSLTACNAYQLHKASINDSWAGSNWWTHLGLRRSLKNLSIYTIKFLSDKKANKIIVHLKIDAVLTFKENTITNVLYKVCLAEP